MAEALGEVVIERQRRRLRGKAQRITIELDPTDDPTHGAQQLSLFNGHYDTWCYLPVAGFIQFDAEPEQYLFTYVLRPGNAPAKLGAIGILRRVLERLRAAFAKARFLVRLDGGFACPEILEFLEAEGVQYVVAMAGNAVLDRMCEHWMQEVRRRSAISVKTEHLYGEVRYAATSWTCERRIVVKAEVVRIGGREPRDNARFVITNLRSGPQKLYEDIYCQRAHIELRIKELHHGLEIDRTSCTRFWANQLRVLLTAAAYVLMQELRTRAGATSCARAQVSHLARAAAQAGRLGDLLGAPHRAASAAKCALALGLVSYRAPIGRSHRLTDAPRFASAQSHLAAGQTATTTRKPAWNKARNNAVLTVHFAP